MMDRRFRVWGSILLLLQLGTLGAPMVRAQTAACSQNCTIWPNAAVPTTADDGPDKSVELGVKFRADSNGTVTGIRFYKASTNTGTHTGSLWSSTGKRLLAT